MKSMFYFRSGDFTLIIFSIVHLDLDMSNSLTEVENRETAAQTDNVITYWNVTKNRFQHYNLKQKNIDGIILSPLFFVLLKCCDVIAKSRVPV